MKIAIVDDEPRWRRLAIEAVKSYADAIKTFDSGIEFLKENREYEIVLMDIEMPGMDGFDTIIKYKEQYPESIIIVLTTHLECARRGYLVNAFRYVDKTKMKEELEEAFEKIKELNRENNYVVTGKDGDVIKNILLKDILYIEAKGRGTVINTKNECYKCDKKFISWKWS